MEHTNTIKRNAAIRSRYSELCKKRSPNGGTLYRHVAMLELLAAEFFLSERTIERALEEGLSGQQFDVTAEGQFE